MKLELRSHNFPVWQGTVSLEKTDDWIKPWRIPYESRNLFHHQLCIRAAMPAGARIIFRSDTSYIEGEIEPQLEENQIDLYCDKIFIPALCRTEALIGSLRQWETPPSASSGEYLHLRTTCGLHCAMGSFGSIFYNYSSSNRLYSFSLHGFSPRLSVV